MVLTLKVKPGEIKGWLALLLGADFWMIFAGSIGDQQFSPADGSLLVGRHLLWGTLSTLGYLVIPYVLFVRLGPRYGGKADDESGHAFRLMALSTVTTWGVYPLGYLVPAIFPHADMNWVHLAYTTADLVNKVGVGVVAYLAGTEELERRVPQESVQHARIVADARGMRVVEWVRPHKLCHPERNVTGSEGPSKRAARGAVSSLFLPQCLAKPPGGSRSFDVTLRSG